MAEEIKEEVAAAEVEETAEATEENSDAAWYVVHTYSGYENKVKANIENTIENRHLQDKILEVRVPLEDVQETRNGGKKTVAKKLLPGYVLIKMVMNDETWYVVRNTRGVTGFVGPGSKPVPLSEDEIKPFEGRVNRVKVDFAVGDSVVAISGAWQDNIGVVKKMDDSKQVVKVAFELFGRETPVDIAYSDVRKV